MGWMDRIQSERNLNPIDSNCALRYRQSSVLLPLKAAYDDDD